MFLHLPGIHSATILKFTKLCSLHLFILLLHLLQISNKFQILILAVCLQKYCLCKNSPITSPKKISFTDLYKSHYVHIWVDAVAQYSQRAHVSTTDCCQHYLTCIRSLTSTLKPQVLVFGLSSCVEYSIHTSLMVGFT